MALRAGFCLAVVWLMAGCAGTDLPAVRKDFIESRMRPMPPGAAPLYSWHGKLSNWPTAWGRQDIRISATLYVPPEWKNPGDEYWRVTGLNGEDKPVPLLGVRRPAVNENGTPIALIVPAVDFKTTPNGLYLIMVPNIQMAAGKVASIQPTAILCEIRKHIFQPFQLRIPLIPDAVSPVTPMPELPPETPAGTPVPGI
jgi:hypothetical protein